MNIGKVLAFILCMFGLWRYHFDEGFLDDIEALLIMIMALIIVSTEKIIEAIEEKESTVIVGEVKSVSPIIKKED